MKLYIAIPALNEFDYLPHTLQAIERQQTAHTFEVFVCINQPERWWTDGEHLSECENNQKTIRWIQNRHFPYSIRLIDKSSEGCGWDSKNFGVGWARKVLFDTIMQCASDEDVIISMDADTVFNEKYFESIADNFEKHVGQAAVSVPYFHPLNDDDKANRAILRYEIYMRNCLLNLMRIGSPYSFTAIGSAIAVNAKALRKIGGITPMKSGEDFYLLQKLRKMAPVSLWNDEIVYPAARFSDRVFFGTGPALIKGSQGIWDSYPIYHFSLFDKVKETYDLIDTLYEQDIDTDFTDFLKEVFKTDDLWGPLRKNSKDLPHFRHSFHEKADGLRILQFLKSKQETLLLSDEECLFENLPVIDPSGYSRFMYEDFQFATATHEQLQALRQRLFDVEMMVRFCIRHSIA